MQNSPTMIARVAASVARVAGSVAPSGRRTAATSAEADESGLTTRCREEPNSA